jgi:hypothetical protein
VVGVTAIIFVLNHLVFKQDLWAWLKLLVVPAVLAAGGIWFNQQQRERELESAKKRTQDEALQAYLDKMSELLIDNKLHEKSDEYDPARITARAQTLAILGRLSADHKRTVLLFLREARLINRSRYSPKMEPNVTYYAHYVGLKDADFSEANLKDARLISTLGKEPISLKGANLKGAKLSGAILRKADLSDADLSNADLSDADLSDADLSDADLRNAKGLTNEQLATCSSLEGATMPDGQILKYEDNPDGPTFEEWLKSKGSEEDEQNGGHS